MQRRGHGDALSIDPRQRRGVRPEHVGQHVGEMVQQVEPIRHLEGRGCSQAGRFRIHLRPIPHEDFYSRMGLKPLGHGRGFPVGEQGHGLPPGKIQEERAIKMALAQGEFVYAEDLWGADRRAGRATDHPQQGVPTDGEAKSLTQSRASRPSMREAHSKEACPQSQGPPPPGCHQPRQPLGEDAAGALLIVAKQLTDAKLPCDSIATPREIGERPGVTTMDTLCKPRQNSRYVYGWLSRPYADARTCCRALDRGPAGAHAGT